MLHNQSMNFFPPAATDNPTSCFFNGFENLLLEAATFEILSCELFPGKIDFLDDSVKQLAQLAICKRENHESNIKTVLTFLTHLDAHINVALSENYRKRLKEQANRYIASRKLNHPDHLALVDLVVDSIANEKKQLTKFRKLSSYAAAYFELTGQQILEFDQSKRCAP